MSEQAVKLERLNRSNLVKRGRRLEYFTLLTTALKDSSQSSLVYWQVALRWLGLALIA